MACNVYVNKELVLDCTVGAFQTMYEIFDECADLNNFYSNINFKNFMLEMFTAVESRCSYGFDFADYIYTPDTIDLLVKTIDVALPALKKELVERVIIGILGIRSGLLAYRAHLDSLDFKRN